MYRDSACSDPNTVQEGGLAKDGFSQTLPSCDTSFSMEELSYLQNPSQQDASEAINGAAMEIELQQQLGLDMGNVGNTHLMQEVVHDSNLQVLPYDQTNWDTNVNHEMQEMSFIPNPHHPRERHLKNLEMENGHRQSFNNSPFQNTPYSPATDLNLFHLPRCSPSSVLTNSTSLNFMNPTQRYAKFPASLGFLGDLPPDDSAAQASNVVYDPLFHLNLPPQGPIFRETLQSLPYGYNLSASRTAACSLFGGGVDEREARGDVNRDGEERHFDNNEFFEFNGDINCMAKESNGKGPDKHFATEKQRRLDLTAKFAALKNLVPNPTKADRASVVGDAVEYIKELLRTVDKLKILVEKKRYGRERRKRRKTEDGANGEFESSKVKPEPDDQSYNGSSMRGSWLQRKSKDTEVDVRIVDDEVTIKLAQRKKMNCLLIVSKVLDELQLDIHHVAGGLVGDNYSFLFNSKICEGSSVYASAIANKLIEVVDRQYAAIPPTSSY